MNKTVLMCSASLVILSIGLVAAKPPPSAIAARCASAECFYYRAVNRGHLLESRTGQYKTDLVLMIADFEEVRKRNPILDDGGALRALGTIYLKLPELSIFGGNLSRDLDKAERYALQALKHFPQNPENLKLKGEIDFAKRDYKSAARFFRHALKNLDKTRLQESERRVLAEELKRWLKKVKKRLKT